MLHFLPPADEPATTEFSGFGIKRLSAVHRFRRPASIAEDHFIFATLYADDVEERLAKRDIPNNRRKVSQ